MRGSMDRNAGDVYGAARPRAGSILILLAMFASGCASASRLPWTQLKQPSVELPKPSNSYGLKDRANGRLPWPKVGPAPRKLAEPSNNFGVGKRASSGLPWPEVKPKSLGPLTPTSRFRLQNDETETGAGLPTAAPPPFLFPNLRDWLQEDDPDGSEGGEDDGDRLLPRSDPGVDIRRPGPDTANFPNSPSTIPQGRVYIENSPISFYGRSKISAPIYNWEFLFRYGLTDRLEFRLFSNGYTNQYGSLRYPAGSGLSALNQGATTGFSPLAWDFKYHLWDEHKKRHLPSAGIEVYIETDMGSPAFSQGTQPSINLLFAQELPFDFEFEWNIGIAGNLTIQNAIYYTLAFQWALQHTLFSEDFVVFTHGYLNNAALPRFAQAAIPGKADVVVAGVGAEYTLTDQLAVFGSYNFGMTPDSPDHLALLGFAFAM